MQTKLLIRLLAVLSLILSFVGSAGLSSAKDGAQGEPSTEELLSEVRQHFTLHGKPISPKIFYDFNFGNVVTVDLEAAISSSFTNPTKNEKGWIEGTYKFIGTTDNGLLIVVAFSDGNFVGPIYKLYILDVADARAFDEEGKLYRRINLTSLRRVFLGYFHLDHGEVSISHNTIRIATTRHDPAKGDTQVIRTIEAERP